MDTDILRDIGLSEGDIKIYLALLKLGTTQTGPLMKEAGMTNSSAYRCLESLMKKGLVSYIVKNNVKHFQAADPKNILRFIEDKKSKLEELLPQLSKKFEPTGQEVKLFEGYKAIRSAYEEGLDDMRSGDEQLFFSITEEGFSHPNIQSYFMSLSVKRRERGITARGIALPGTRSIFEKYPVRPSMRYTDLKLPHGISIFKTKVIFITLRENPTAILIRSKEMTETYRHFFESMWEIAER